MRSVWVVFKSLEIPRPHLHYLQHSSRHLRTVPKKVVLAIKTDSCCQVRNLEDCDFIHPPRLSRSPCLLVVG